MRTLTILSVVMLVASFASAEMLVNGDFSTNTLVDRAGGTYGARGTGAWITDTNWSQGWDISTGEAVYDDAGNDYNKGIVQIVDIAAGDYTVSFDINNIANPQWGAYWYVGVVDAADSIPEGAAIVSGANRIYEGNLNAYVGTPQTVTYNFSVPQDAIDLGGMDYIVVGFTGNGPSGDLRIDNVSLTPEPATMSLLGLGGLALLRRRRR